MPRDTIAGPDDDPYRWLEDGSAAAVVNWVSDQAAAARELLDELPDRTIWMDLLRHAAAGEVVGPPTWAGDVLFFTRRDAETQRETLRMKSRSGERVVLDPALAHGADAILEWWRPCPDGTRILYRIADSDEEASLYVIRSTDGAVLDGPIDRCRGSVGAWEPDGSAFFYVRRLPPDQVPDAEASHHRRIWRHVVESPAADDEEVFGEQSAPMSYFAMDVSPDGRWLAMSSRRGAARRTEVWIAEIDGPVLKPPSPLQVGHDAYARVTFGADRLFVLTDLEAPFGFVYSVDPARPSDRRIVVPERPGSPLTDAIPLKDGGCVTVHLTDAHSELRRYHGDGSVTDIALPGIGTVTELTSHPDGRVWAGWTGYRDLATVLFVDYGATEAVPWPYLQAPAQAPVGMTVRELWFESADGTRIHAFVCEPPARERQALPTILTGYGGFGVPLRPAYQPSVTAWVQAGGRYVIANLRGGGEYGAAWHRCGMRDQKNNVFADFAAVTDGLYREGLCDPGRLAITGTSNGGLLVGVALTRAPESYAAVACFAPLLDMARYDRFGLGALWRHEYGDPRVPAQLAWLLSYSPYHHVRSATRYPAVLFATFDDDTRVDPLHARKMCAALQASVASHGGGPVVLRCEHGAGHGSRSMERVLNLAADELAFLAHHVGLRPG